MKFICTALFILMVTLSWSQDFDALITAHAKAYNKALIDADYESIVDYTDQDIVAMGGGEKLMVDVEKQKHQVRQSSGIIYKKITPQHLVSTAINGNEIQAVLSQEIILSLADSEFKKTGYYLIRSKDRGETWGIIDLEPFDDDSIKEFIPTISPDISIPQPDQGEMIKEK